MSATLTDPSLSLLAGPGWDHSPDAKQGVLNGDALGTVGLCSWQNFDSIGLSQSNPIPPSQSASHRCLAQYYSTNPCQIRHSLPPHVRICVARSPVDGRFDSPAAASLHPATPALKSGCPPGFSRICTRLYGPLLGLTPRTRAVVQATKRPAPRSSASFPSFIHPAISGRRAWTSLGPCAQFHPGHGHAPRPTQRATFLSTSEG